VISEIIDQVLRSPDDISVLEKEQKKSLALCKDFPLPY
jgi:hypothetical protein